MPLPQRLKIFIHLKSEYEAMLDLDDKPILTEVQTLICFVSVRVVVVMAFCTTNSGEGGDEAKKE